MAKLWLLSLWVIGWIYYLDVPFTRFSQEPRKSDAPQLRDEYRSYRTLNGTRKYFYVIF